MFGNPSYPTYQAFLGLGIAAAIALLLMPWWIKLLKVEGIGQQVRADGPKRHLVKQGTPTMGGLMFILGIGVAIVTEGWEEIQRGNFIYLFVYLFALVFGAIGFVDDFQKLRHQHDEKML